MVNIVGMTDNFKPLLVSIAGMAPGKLIEIGGQDHRNDPEHTYVQVVNIAGIVKSILKGVGGQDGQNEWSASSARVVKMERIIHLE